ncbi:hypothetical protein [Streptomyces hainanensis]|uniref:Uncharacterized protein n=1 Tax=Streptomyces hainanensis TaxID=402648 RepID=A0A4R4TQN2_9ACTN|nr:hypothetical protein [Streptomyces hainanensis]TDC76419.1 hypothetical protein E1283_09795 [Streptomyces hainanensis]
MLRQARSAGWDVEETEDVDGVATPRSHILLVWALIALSEGLTPEQTAHLARGFGVAPQEVTDAYLPEMRQRVMDDILDNPDLKQLDEHLDGLT